MRLIDLSHNDSLATMASKSNANFKNLAWLISRYGRPSSITDIDSEISELRSEIAELGHTVLDYNNLDNKPSIESITLQGNKTFRQLGIDSIANSDIENLLT